MKYLKIMVIVLAFIFLIGLIIVNPAPSPRLAAVLFIFYLLVSIVDKLQ